MKPTRRLALRADLLTDLSADQLRDLAGGEQLTPQCATTPLDLCAPTTPVIQCIVSWPCAEITG